MEMPNNLKYKSEDYPCVDFHLDDIKTKYADYLESNKEPIKLIILKEAINELRNGLKSAIILRQITKEKAEEMMDYYWGLIGW